MATDEECIVVFIGKKGMPNLHFTRGLFFFLHVRVWWCRWRLSMTCISGSESITELSHGIMESMNSHTSEIELGESGS